MIWFASYIHLYTTILNIQKEIDFPMLQLVLSSFLATAAFKATCARWQKKTGMPRRDRCGCRKWDCSWRMNHLSWQIIKHLEKAVSINKQLPFLFFSKKHLWSRSFNIFTAMGKANVSRKISRRAAAKMSSQEFTSYKECCGSSFRQQQKGRILAGLRALKAPSVT